MQMQRKALTVATALFWSACAVEPLSRDDANKAALRLEKLHHFVNDNIQHMLTTHYSQCMVNSQKWKDNCANVTESDCRPSRCDVPGHYDKNQSWCNANHPNSWRRDGTTLSNACCEDGSPKCKYDANGKEIPCCDICIRTEAELKSAMNISRTQLHGPGKYCASDGSGYLGPAVCGTKAGKCGYCYEDRDRDDQGDCTNHGSCSKSCNGAPCQSKDPCTGMGGSWHANTWVVNTNAVTEAACLTHSYCGTCTNITGSANDPNSCQGSDSMGHCSCNPSLTMPIPQGCYADKAQCVANGHVWYHGHWERDYSVKSEGACKAKNYGTGDNKFEWKKGSKFEEGSQVAAPPMDWMQSCSTGPSHELEGRPEVENGQPKYCANDTQLLADAEAGLSAAEALSANSWYYGKMLPKMMGPNSFLRAVVTNAAASTGVVDNASISFSPGACFTTVPMPKNKGKITVNPGPKVNILIVEPHNYAEAESIDLLGGQIRVIGGKNYGKISSTTTGKIEILSTTNYGPIHIANSQDVFIANVVNHAGANIKVKDIKVTLSNIVNSANLHVSGAVTAAGYDIVNHGQVTVDCCATGVIHTICPSNGTVTIAAGVKANVTYEKGCMGTITNNAGSNVHLIEIEKKQTVIAGNMGMSVPDADAFLADEAAKGAVKEGIADAAGVETQHVAATFTKSRRLSDQGQRQLAGSSVTVSYTITVPQTMPSSKASQVTAKMNTITPAELTKSVVKKVQAAKGNSYAVAVTSKAAPTVAKVTTTTTTTTTTTVTTTTTAVTTTTVATTTTTIGSANGTGATAGSATGGSATTGSATGGVPSAVVPSFCMLTLLGAMTALLK